ncbi:phage portal protein [Limosilactobacillus fastidiosus]|nr:phage portal protein [Limosilactobacillus fastidiosus]MCD7086243.1 phage portal protein [Limosilactobacillus fastidiosus]MCD7115006.1 phage portal protein [Limosilactobacillus fastidiosus]MCD7116831.1 phage portal protein [Limosilactobacillus fastidiosus]
MDTNKYISGNAYVTKEGMYLSASDEIDSDTLRAFIDDNQSRATQYGKNYQLYSGKHDILKQPSDPNSSRPDNRLVSNWANYVVNTYVGYFMGKPVKITFDNDSANKKLQDWFNNNSFQDKLADVAKQVAIYGRSYMLAYQDENAETKIATVEPDEGFMIYDTTINHNPLAFVRYNYFNSRLSGEMYTQNQIVEFADGGTTVKTTDHLFGSVPAVEFYSNGARLSLVGKIATLVDEYDSAFSRKANQVDYFDQAYLKILGVPLQRDKETGEPILDLGANKVLYSPDADAANGVVDFISKPDGDNMQENMLNRLKDDIFQTAMVANLNDDTFSGNSSGVAIRYKLLPMQNQAASEERKFTISLRYLLGSVLSIGTVIGSADVDQIRKDLKFQFVRNIPLDIANEAQAASTMSGIVSKETQLSTLSFVDDPKAEMKRIQDEQAEQVKQALKNAASATDSVKDDNDGEQEVLAGKGTSREEVDGSEPRQ